MPSGRGLRDRVLVAARSVMRLRAPAHKSHGGRGPWLMQRYVNVDSISAVAAESHDPPSTTHDLREAGERDVHRLREIVEFGFDGVEYMVWKRSSPTRASADIVP